MSRKRINNIYDCVFYLSSNKNGKFDWIKLLNLCAFKSNGNTLEGRIKLIKYGISISYDLRFTEIIFFRYFFRIFHELFAMIRALRCWALSCTLAGRSIDETRIGDVTQREHRGVQFAVTFRSGIRVFYARRYKWNYHGSLNCAIVISYFNCMIIYPILNGE